MRLVVDTNILIAALLRKGDTRKLLFSRQNTFFSPECAQVEIRRHQSEFLEKGPMNEEQFEKTLKLELENVSIVPDKECVPFKFRAKPLCPHGHEDDWPFLALALKLNCCVWSNDAALKKQSEVPIFSTRDLLKKTKSNP